MGIVEELIVAARARDWSLVLPEDHDGRVVQAGRRPRDEGVANVEGFDTPDLKDVKALLDELA